MLRASGRIRAKEAKKKKIKQTIVIRREITYSKGYK